MKNEWKNEILPSCLAGVIAGIICLLGIVFIAPEKWYLAFPAAAIMACLAFYAAVSEKRKLAARYDKYENMIENGYFASAEGYIRTDSDSPAKFFFGEEYVSVLSCKKPKPALEVIPKEKIVNGGFDRCGWLSLIVKGENRRMVFSSENGAKIKKVLEDSGWLEKAEN